MYLWLACVLILTALFGANACRNVFYVFFLFLSFRFNLCLQITVFGFLYFPDHKYWEMWLVVSNLMFYSMLLEINHLFTHLQKIIDCI